MPGYIQIQLVTPESCFLFTPVKSKSNGLIVRHNGALNKVCLGRLKKKERPIPRRGSALAEREWDAD
jgi:hypothetical protein